MLKHTSGLTGCLGACLFCLHLVEQQFQEAQATGFFSSVFFKRLDSREVLIKVSFSSCPCLCISFPYSHRQGGVSSAGLPGCKLTQSVMSVPNAVVTGFQPHVKLAVLVFPYNKYCGS